MRVMKEPQSPQTILIVNFTEILTVAAANKELIKEFDRLTGCNLSLVGSPLDLGIDKATGKLTADIERFIAFVYEDIYCRIKESPHD